MIRRIGLLMIVAGLAAALPACSTGTTQTVSQIHGAPSGSAVGASDSLGAIVFDTRDQTARDDRVPFDSFAGVPTD